MVFPNKGKLEKTIINSLKHQKNWNKVQLLKHQKKRNKGSTLEALVNIINLEMLYLENGKKW